jgi:hypothetical protein
MGEAEASGEGRGRAGLHDIRIGVRGEEGAVATDQSREHRALIAVFGDGRHAAQEKRVVRKQHSGAEFDGLVDRVAHGVDREMDVPNLGSQITRNQP